MDDDNLYSCFQEKVAIITGANNPMGIGAEVAFKLAEQGAKVVLIYKPIRTSYDPAKISGNGLDRYLCFNSDNCDKVEKRLKSISANYLILEKDISDLHQIQEIFDSTCSEFGVVDILINNAAACDLSGNDNIFSINSNIINGTFETNVKGTLLMIHEFITRFKSSKQQSGRIINLSTDSAQVFAGQVAYGASKAATEAFTRSIAMEVGHLGITVNAVAPGPTQTGWIDETLEKSLLSSIPISRLGTTKDIANAILFLASKKASWITGQVLKVAGGHVMQ